MSITRLNRPNIASSEVRAALQQRNTPYYQLIGYSRHIAWYARIRTRAESYYRRRLMRAKIDNLHHIQQAGYMESTDAIPALAALAQSTRLDTFRLLVRHEPDGLPVCELARLLDIPQNTMSAHLATLSRADLVRRERRSRSIIYRAKLDQLRDLILFLVKDCCGGYAELCAPLIAELTPYCPPQEIRQ